MPRGPWVVCQSLRRTNAVFFLRKETTDDNRAWSTWRGAATHFEGEEDAVAAALLITDDPDYRTWIELLEEGVP